MCPSDALTIESGYLMGALYQAEFINRAQMRLMHIMIEDLILEENANNLSPSKENRKKQQEDILDDGPQISTKYMN